MAPRAECTLDPPDPNDVWAPGLQLEADPRSSQTRECRPEGVHRERNQDPVLGTGELHFASSLWIRTTVRAPDLRST